jgi:hypothetical protein
MSAKVEKEARPMKTMTCLQLGGPCDLPLRGDTADQVIKAQDEHLNEAVSAGGQEHEPALKEMKNRWKLRNWPRVGQGPITDTVQQARRCELAR